MKLKIQVRSRSISGDYWVVDAACASLKIHDDNSVSLYDGSGEVLYFFAPGSFDYLRRIVDET